jgi:hypothetical protein
MKSKLFSVLIVFMLMPLFAFGQLKKDTKMPDISQVISQPANNFLLNFSDPSKFQMHHTLSMSFGMAGKSQMLQNSYLNTMLFSLSDDLTLRTDIGILSTPYHTFGENSGLNDPRFFGGAELNYKISENSSIQLRFDSLPYSGYYNYYNRYNSYYSPFYRQGLFDRE